MPRTTTRPSRRSVSASSSRSTAAPASTTSAVSPAIPPRFPSTSRTFSASRRCRSGVAGPLPRQLSEKGGYSSCSRTRYDCTAQPPAGDAEHELACTGWPSAVRLAVSRAATGGSAAPPFPSPGDGADPGWRCDDQWRSHRRPKRLCPATLESTPIGTQACCRHSPFRDGSTARRSVTRTAPAFGRSPNASAAGAGRGPMSRTEHPQRRVRI